MSLFCIIGFDIPNSEPKRKPNQEAHCKYLNKLQQAGKLLAAGPLLSSTKENAAECGSMLVVDFESQEAAQNWYNSDPYYLAGVYASLQVIPYFDAMDYLKKYNS